MDANSEKDSQQDDEKGSTSDEVSASTPPYRTNDSNSGYDRSRNDRLLTIRKVKSREAARTRRGKENYEFYELAKLLPIPAETSSQLDKASIIRLTKSYLKMREFAYHGNPPWNMLVEGPPPNRTVKDTSASRNKSFLSAAVKKTFEEELGTHLLQSLDGFLFVLTCQGKFIYISETVSVYLGLSQVEMIGSSIFDYTHPADHNDLILHLGMTLSSQSKPSNEKSIADCKKHIGFFIRMKSALTRRGVNLKSSSYKVIHITSQVRLPHLKRGCVKKNVSSSDKSETDSETGEATASSTSPLGLCGIGSALPPPTLNDIRLEKPMFVTRLNPAFKFTFCEAMVQDLLGYEVKEIVGNSFYHMIHAGDVNKLKYCHTDILNKGQTMTPYYRWLCKSGGYIWMQSCVTVLTNQRLYPDQSFVWINYVISQPMDKTQILDVLQLSPEEMQLRLDSLRSKAEASKQNGKASAKSKSLASKNAATGNSTGVKQVAKRPSRIHKKLLTKAVSNSVQCESTVIKESIEEAGMSVEVTVRPLCLVEEGEKDEHSCQETDENNNCAQPKTKNKSNCNTTNTVIRCNSKSSMNKCESPVCLSASDTDKSNLSETSVGEHLRISHNCAAMENPTSFRGEVQKKKLGRKRHHKQTTPAKYRERRKTPNIPLTTSKIDVECTQSSTVKENQQDSQKKQKMQSSPDSITSLHPFVSLDSNSTCKNVSDSSDTTHRNEEVSVGTSVSETKSSEANVPMTDYLDTDSVIWLNPPNKEISNHSDLPPGIKQMHSLWGVRRPPSAVHHHYPFGINPTLLHSNPLLAKMLMASWGGYHHLPSSDTYVMTAPIQFVQQVRNPHMKCPPGLPSAAFISQATAQTPASVSAILEELKKDPLHKVGPPNKVVVQGMQDSSGKSTLISGSKHLLHSTTSDSQQSTRKNNGTTFDKKSNYSSKELGEDSLNLHLNTQMLQVTNPIINMSSMPASNVLFTGTHSPLVAFGPNTMLNLPMASSSFQQQISPIMMQPFTFPKQVAKLPSVPL